MGCGNFAFMFCVSTCAPENTILDDKEKVLSQLPRKPLSEMQSASYGNDMLDNDDGVVSLECNGDTNLELDISRVLQEHQGSAFDGTAIGDILSHEEMKKVFKVNCYFSSNVMVT